MSDSETTAGEHQVFADAPSGQLVDLSDLPNEQRIVSPSLIRRLCVGPEAAEMDPRGIRIKGARIVEPLNLSFCTVAHPLFFEATAFSAAPDLRWAQIPAVWLKSCTLPGLLASGIRTGQLSLHLSNVSGDVLLVGARIDGRLICAGATLSNEGGSALTAESAEIAGDVLLNEGFKATGEVRLLGAKLARLLCQGATLSNEAGVALLAEGTEINGGVFLNEGFRATGEVQFIEAKIRGPLVCAGATLSNEGGSALAADQAHIFGGVALNEGFNATGEVRLLGAKIDGQLACQAATLSNEGGYALSASQAEILGGVYFVEGFSAIGGVQLAGARIGGQLVCMSATLVTGERIALDGRHVRISDTLIFRDVQVTGGVDFFRASTTTLEDDLGHRRDSLGSWSNVAPLNLDSFAYERFGQLTAWDSRLRRKWLEQTDGFQQGAWQQLVQVYRAIGRDDEVTTALIAMHNDRVARLGLPTHRVLGRYILRVVVGHGYRPWLAAVWAAAIIAAFAVVVWQWSGLFLPERQGVTEPPQPLAYAADTFLPIVDLGQADSWMPSEAIRWVEWCVILLGWSLSTIFVAGFTRIVRSQ